MTSSRKAPDSRRTALLVGCVLLALAIWNYHRQHSGLAWALSLSGAWLLLIWLLLPVWARKFHSAWMRVGGALGYVNTRILLGVMHYGILTPFGMLMRMGGHNRLDRRGQGRESYWIPRNATRQTKEQFERLF